MRSFILVVKFKARKWVFFFLCQNLACKKLIACVRTIRVDEGRNCLVTLAKNMKLRFTPSFYRENNSAVSFLVNSRRIVQTRVM